MLGYGRIRGSKFGLVLPANSANPGRLMGNGTIVTNLVTNSGRIAPDELTGTLTMTGAFAQTASGTLDIELRNLTSFDLLVGRRRCLDGHLQ